MDKIRLLPAELVAKIAAGEVIERPASVVKELIENSLDAGASDINITLKDAGKTLIRITDNGSGIDEEGLNHLFQRHATSKISSLDDLYRIDSLGFRGEALYSIGAIADVTLRSKAKEEPHGWELRIRANNQLSKKPSSAAQGTDIQVQELFFNTPARKKFLKSNSSELSHLLETVIPYTLLLPAVRFTLTHNEKTILSLTASASLTRRIAEVLHLEENNLIETFSENKEDAFSIHLALGDINIQRTRKDMQFIFVNNRPVSNKTLSFHLNDIYRMLFSHGVYPFFFASFQVPAENIDVNVHPAKREIKLKDETKLVAFLRAFAERTLMEKSKPRSADTKGFIEPLKISAYSKTMPAAEKNTLSVEETLTLFNGRPAPVSEDRSLKEKLKQSIFIGTFYRKYLLFETEDSLLIVDQHAAQERITFERLQGQIEKRSIEVQRLLSPEMIVLSPQELLLWEENKEQLEELGFETSLFDKHTLALHAHPNLIDHPQQSIRDLLGGGHISKMPTDAIARLACRSSVMAGTQLNKEQAEYQRQALLQARDMFTCPHGRPTIVEIKESFLSRQFLRT